MRPEEYRIGHQTSKGVLYIPLKPYKPYVVILKSGKQLKSSNLVSLKRELS